MHMHSKSLVELVLFSPLYYIITIGAKLADAAGAGAPIQSFSTK